VHQAGAVLDKVPLHHRRRVASFNMSSESDPLAAKTAEGAGIILDSFTASLLSPQRGAAGTASPGEVNVAQVQQAVEDYNNATHKEPEGPKPERRRDATNMVTGADVKAQGGANIIGDLQSSSWTG